MWFTTQQNSKPHTIFFLLFNNSLNMYVCKTKQSLNFHQVPKLHPTSFPSKSNLKIKLMKCLNPIQLINHIHLALLNLYHSHGNNDVIVKISLVAWECWVQIKVKIMNSVVCFYNPTWAIQCVFACLKRLWFFTLNHWWKKCFLELLKTSSDEKFLSTLNFAIRLEQSTMQCVLVACFEKLKVLFCINNKKNCFHELLRISSDEIFWALTFQVISMNFPMFGPMLICWSWFCFLIA
jgi:hypothetical protein